MRIPASLCGVVGFKPTIGSIDTDGVLPLSPSLDTVGSFGPDVLAASRGAEMMSGRSGVALHELPPNAPLKLAVPHGWVFNLDNTVGSKWEEIAASLPRIPFPSLATLTRYSLDILYAEASAIHRRWVASNSELYGRDVLERLRQALKTPAADYVDALHHRRIIRSEVAAAMSGVDALLLPTTAAVAPLIGPNINVEPLARFTRPFNYTGQPVFSLPVPGSGLPVGIQVIGHLGQDTELARVAQRLQDILATGPTAV